MAEDEDGKVAACLMGYRLGEQPEPIGPDLPPIFVPMQELENEAPGSWYVNVLATFPAYRGRGWGTALLGQAERLAVSLGCPGLSLIVADDNVGARRLYERCGFREVAFRPMVKEQWAGPGERWLLMTRPVAA
jgi:ribosomal protein S18 acetylase RimI-like enzyme